MRKKKVVLLSLTSAATLTVAALAVFLTRNNKVNKLRADNDGMYQYEHSFYIDEGFPEPNATATHSSLTDSHYYPFSLTGETYNQTDTLATVPYTHDGVDADGTYIYVWDNKVQADIVDGMIAAVLTANDGYFEIHVKYDLYDNLALEDGYPYLTIMIYDSSDNSVRYDDIEPSNIEPSTNEVYFSVSPYDPDDEEEDYQYDSHYIRTTGSYIAIQKVSFYYFCE